MSMGGCCERCKGRRRTLAAELALSVKDWRPVSDMIVVIKGFVRVGGDEENAGEVEEGVMGESEGNKEDFILDW